MSPTNSGPSRSLGRIAALPLLLAALAPPHAARAQAPEAAAPPVLPLTDAVKVVSLRVSPPPAGGQFATVNYTIDGTRGSVLPKDVTPVLLRPDGREESFDVIPLGWPDYPVLTPGKPVPLRRFKKVEPGHYRVALRWQDGARRLAVAGAKGREASVPLEVAASALVPQPVFMVRDERARHLYREGETIRLRLTPFFIDGDDLAPQVSALKMSPAQKPFAISGDERAQSLLKSELPLTEGFIADFFGVDEARRSLDVVAEFRQPVALSSLQMAGVHLNGEYGLSKAEIEATRPDGSRFPLAAHLFSEGNRWTLRGVLGRASLVSALRVRLWTPYKINITSLQLRGQAAPATGASASPASPSLAFHWEEFGGRRLSAPRPLVWAQETLISCPPSLAPGYYALVLDTRPPGSETLRREYGFVVRESTLGPIASPQSTLAGAGGLRGDDRMGVVHSDLTDALLGSGLSKTLATPGFYDAASKKVNREAWRQALRERRELGLDDLPIVIGEGWNTDSTRPVSPQQLQTLKAMMLQFFGADPSVEFWELGLEENLQLRPNLAAWTHYYANLEAKARVVGEAAREVNPRIKLIYQVAEIDLPSIEGFLSSRAARQFDILSSHPYAWPDFQPPHRWMPPFLKSVRDKMARHKVMMPIWFTEVGAPLDGNPGGFFGYPGPQAFVRGLSREEHAAYIVQCHALALQQGVQRIYWYNYRDGSSNPEYAEDFFGMIDVRGFPRPSYAAYATMSRLLRAKQPVQAPSPAGLALLRFRGGGEECLVAWSTSGSRRVPLSQLPLPTGTRQAFDLMGRPLSMQKAVVLGSAPIFITTRP